MAKTRQEFDFGVIVQDKITLFKGVVTGFTSYITGCDQYLVQPQIAKDGDKVEDPRWFDVDRLHRIDGARKITLGKERDPRRGADAPAPLK